MKRQAEKGLGPLLPGLALALGLSFMLFLYAPYELYLTNKDDFWFTAGQMLPYTLGLFLAAMLVIALCLLLAGKLSPRLLFLGTALLAFALIGCYVQGSFLVAGLPGMDGSLIDLNDYPALRLQSVLCWAGSAALVLLLIRLLGPARFSRAAGFFGAGMTLLLALTMGGLFLTHTEPKRATLAATDTALLSMSDEENFIVVHLDAVDACVFEDVLDGDAEYREALRDFTYYDNTLSGYPSTKCSVPLILTGQWYEAQESFDAFADEAMSASPLFASLEERGYALGLYDVDNFFLSKELFDGRFENMREDRPTIGSDKAMAGMMVRMALVKFAPWDLKGPGFHLTRKLQNFRQFRDTDDCRYYNWANELFYARLQEGQPITLRAEKSFKYIELVGAHNPFIYLKDVSIGPDADYRSCVEACLTVSAKLLDRMRECGVYDNSVIVLLADHGYNPDYDDTNYNQHPLLLIKGRGESHPLAVNNAPISHVDLCGAFLRLLDGADAASCFDWQAGQTRERRFLRYDWRDLTWMEEYVQTGQAEDMNTLRPTGRIFER